MIGLEPCIIIKIKCPETDADVKHRANIPIGTVRLWNPLNTTNPMHCIFQYNGSLPNFYNEGT